MTEEKKTKKRRRPSPEVLEEAAAVQEKMREEQLAKAPKKKESKDAGKISYDQWWMMIQKKVKLRPHLKEVIWADFKARGAGKMESEEKYDELLKVFGYKW